MTRRAQGTLDLAIGGLNALEFTLNFVGRATPIVGTVMSFAQDGAKEGFISLAGDVAFFATFGLSKAVTTSANGARAATALRLTAVGAQAYVGGARSQQAYFAIQQGNYVGAAGYMGEALLRFIGVRKGIIDQMKSIQTARAAAAQAAKQLPSGFVTAEEFANFGEELSSVLKGAGAKDAKAFLQGSSVTGVRRYAKAGIPAGTPFDVIKQSDFDVAIVSPELFSKAKAVGIPIRQGTRTAPLIKGNFYQLGLGNVRERLLQMLYYHEGRRINFVIYDSVKSALSRGTSLEIPGS